MKKKLISVIVLITLLAACLCTFAATESNIDCDKYISKVITVDGKDKMIFDSELARIAKKMAMDSYKIRYDSNAYDIASTMKQEGFTDIQQSHLFDDTYMDSFSNNFLVGAKTFMIDGKEKHVIAIAFRGTTVDGLDYADLFSDASVLGLNGFHSGFYMAALKAFNTLYDMKFPSLKNEDGSIMTFGDYLSNSGIIGSDYSILVTGHSLGGAIANIFAGDIITTLGKSNVMCYTFASPIVCSESEAKEHDAYNIFNIINSNDIVPKVGYNIFSGTRLGTDLVVTVSDSEENSHNLAVTYDKALEKVISNIDSCYPYIHRICYDNKDEVHIHRNCTLQKRQSLNFKNIKNLILSGNMTLDGADLYVNDLTVNNVTITSNVGGIINCKNLSLSNSTISNMPITCSGVASISGNVTIQSITAKMINQSSGTLTVNGDIISNGDINFGGTVTQSSGLTKLYGDITDSGGTVTLDNLELCGKLPQTIGIQITVNDFKVSNKKSVTLNNKMYVNGDYITNGKIANEQNVIFVGQIRNDTIFDNVLNMNSDLIIEGCTVTAKNGVALQGNLVIKNNGKLITNKITLTSGNVNICNNSELTTKELTLTSGNVNITNNSKLTVNGLTNITGSSSNRVSIDETSEADFNKLTIISNIGSVTVNGTLQFGSDASLTSTTIQGDGTIKLYGDLIGSSLNINKPKSFNIIGKLPQSISASGANFDNLFVDNPSKGGVNFNSQVYYYGTYKTNNSKVTGTVTQK